MEIPHKEGGPGSFEPGEYEKEKDLKRFAYLRILYFENMSKECPNNENFVNNMLLFYSYFSSFPEAATGTESYSSSSTVRSSAIRTWQAASL